MMGLFLVLFWCSIVAGDILWSNSRFGVFSSRFGEFNSRLVRSRELAGKSLIRLTVFAAKNAVKGENRENSRFQGKNREFARLPEAPAAQPTGYEWEAAVSRSGSSGGSRWGRGGRRPPRG